MKLRAKIIVLLVAALAAVGSAGFGRGQDKKEAAAAAPGGANAAQSTTAAKNSQLDSFQIHVRRKRF